MTTNGNSLGTTTMGTFFGIVLAFIFVFFILPMAACMTCVTIGAAGHNIRNATTPKPSLGDKGNSCNNSFDCRGSLVCSNNICNTY